MKKTNIFKVSYPKFIYIIASLTIFIALLAILFNLFKLLQIFNLPAFNPAIDIVSMVLAFSIIGIVLYSIFYSRFNFKEQFLSFSISFFYINIPYENILLLRHDMKTNLLLLYYNNPTKDEEENIKYLIVSINNDSKDKFIKLIKQKNKRTIYEIFDKNTEID